MDSVTRLSFEKVAPKLITKTLLNMPLGICMMIFSRMALKVHSANDDDRLTYHFNATLLSLSMGTFVTSITIIEVLAVNLRIASFKRLIQTFVRLSYVKACVVLITALPILIIAHESRHLVRETTERLCMKQIDVTLDDHEAITRFKKICVFFAWNYLTLFGCVSLLVALKFWMDKCCYESALKKIREFEEPGYDTLVYFGHADDVDQDCQ